MIADLQGYLADRLNAPDAVFVLDETGFPKQGTRSVGIARQYCGTLGKVGNCQVGVFLAYTSLLGTALVDHRLYLPERWTADRARCAAAGVPAAVPFQTKAELRLAMLRQVRTRGHLGGRWVTAGEGYGQVPGVRDSLNAEGWHYVRRCHCRSRSSPKPPPPRCPPGPGAGTNRPNPAWATERPLPSRSRRCWQR